MNPIEQIFNLKNAQIDSREKGYRFESLIREIMPWDSRPPIVMSPKSEQLDGVFEYKSIYFLIEAKAVKKVITSGSKEWEDYELKLRKRNGRGVIGIFCSLFDVSEELKTKVNNLNESGFLNILIFGSNWDDLFKNQFEFSNFLDFMILNSKIKNVSWVKDLKDPLKWHFDKELIQSHFKTITEKHSSIFIGRFKHEKHDEIFVERNLSKNLDNQFDLIRPNNLKKSRNESLSQIIVLRDISGSGKTTSTINYITSSSEIYCFGNAANQVQLDIFFNEFLSKIKYPKYGLNELIAVDKPIVYIIDSLDEVERKGHYPKRKEIKSLIKKIDELNKIAIEQKIVKFPIILFFTIRDEYWDDWDEVFEGRDVIQLRNGLSMYSENEFREALLKYSDAYHFKIINSLNSNSKKILSIPINLEIFSLAYAYNGDIIIDDIWIGDVIKQFFNRKYNNIQSKHFLDQFSEKIFNEILANCSYLIISNKSLIFEKLQILNIIKTKYPFFYIQTDEILKLIISEQIFIENWKDKSKLSFKYNRFVEYYIALFIIFQILETKEFNYLNRYIQDLYESDVVDPYTVLKNIKTICFQDEYIEIGKQIVDYYHNSEAFLNIFLPKLRYEISMGGVTNNEEIKEMVGKTFMQNPKINWDIFHIISAKNNNQNDERIVASFISAWEANSKEGKLERWKLIDKLSSRGRILFNEKVVNALFLDSISKDWEVFFGKILQFPLHDKDIFFEFWIQLGGDLILKRLASQDTQEWKVALKLLDIFSTNGDYILGDIFSEIDSGDEYIVFDKKKRYKIETESKNRIDDFVKNLFHLTNNDNHIFGYYNFHIPKFEDKDEFKYFIDEFEVNVENKINNSKEPFFNFLLKNYIQYQKLTNFLIKNTKIVISYELVNYESNETLLKLLTSSYPDDSHFYIFDILDYIYSKGYSKNSIDDLYFNDISILKVGSTFHLVKSYYLINNRLIGKKLQGLEKVLFTLASFKNNCVIGFKFTDLISVANNAIQHYKEYSELIIHALKFYGQYDLFYQKKSFQNKIEQLVEVEQKREISEVLISVFPELF